jgi:hypothetical protein
MPDVTTYVDFPQARISERATTNDGMLLGPNTLIEAIRLIVQGALTEILQVPESLSEAASLGVITPPFVVINVTDDSDVSGDYAVNDEGQSIPVELIYCARTAKDGATDTAQNIRPRLSVLERAFLADRTLGGIVTRTEVAHTPAFKSNQYEQFFAGEGQPVTCLVLTLEFHVVQSVAGVYHP